PRGRTPPRPRRSSPTSSRSSSPVRAARHRRRSTGSRPSGRRSLAPSPAPAVHPRRRLAWVHRTLVAPSTLAVIVLGAYPLAFLVAAAASRSTLGAPFQEWVGLA